MPVALVRVLVFLRVVLLGDGFVEVAFLDALFPFPGLVFFAGALLFPLDALLFFGFVALLRVFPRGEDLRALVFFSP